MYVRRHSTTARVAVVAAGILTALTMTSLPSYAEEPAPTPSESPSESPSAEPSQAPSESPSGEPPSDSPAPPAPTGSSPPAGDPSPGEDSPPGTVPVDLGVTAPGSKVTVGSAGKWVRIDVDNMGYGTAENVRVTLQTGDLSDQVTVELPGEDQDCQIDGTTSVCTYPDLDPGDIDTYVAFQVIPKPGATEGAVGTVTASVTSDNPDFNPDNDTTDLSIELVGSGPDLTSFAAAVGPVKPGKSEPLYIGVVNQGDQPTSSLTITLTLPAYAKFVERYADCTYANNYRTVTCSAPDLVLEPGEGIDLSEAFTVAVSKHAPGPVVLGRGAFTASGEAGEPVKGKRSGGSLLGRTAGSAVSAQEMVPGDDTVTFPVKTTRNPADLAVTASRAEGEAGDTVKVKFTVTNRGPADLTGFHIKITAPTGTTISGDPSDEQLDCSPDSGGNLDSSEADCNFRAPLRSGKSKVITLAFVIQAEQVGKDGKAVVDAWTPGGDPKLKNNTATIVIGPPGSGGGGGGGGLPVTGTSLAGLVGGGVAAVLLGLVLFLAARWRRTGLA
ncbi:MAG: hypothetical protein ACRDTM_09290 [Micromonosporaceae bacterium]